MFLFNAAPVSPFLWTTPFVIGGFFLVAWTILWKGLALWHAARRGQTGWFIAMLVINTAGILEICYLLFVANALGDTEGKHENPAPRRAGTKRRTRRT